MPKDVQCKKCRNFRDNWCGQKIDSPDPDLIRDCNYYCTKTNFDVVMQMNPQELAEFLARSKPFAKFCRFDCDDHKPCWSCALDWLNKEVEG